MTWHLILAALAVLAVAVLVVLASPVRTCVRCKGERVARHRLTGRLGPWRRCRGTGRHYRRGAVTVHRARWALRRAVAAELAQRRRPGASQTEPAPGGPRKDTPDVM